MPDLKDLLSPLAACEMPERWDRIQRRPVEPMEDPRRSRAGAMVAAGLAAVVTLAVVAVLWPLGTGSGPGPRTSETQPPAWLVDLAYRTAYENGDITPDSASWVLSDANTIAPAIGLESGDPSVQEYLVVLKGQFTAFMAKVPSGASLPKGSVLTFAADAGTRQVTDWGVGDHEVDVPGLQTFTLPDASQTYTSSQGWTVAVPPDWKTAAFSSEGVMIANTTLPPPSADDPTIWGANGFPLDGLALVVETAGAGVPAKAQASSPPLSFDDFVTPDSLTGSGSIFFTELVQGPNGRYFAVVRMGRQVSPIDRAAIEDVVASLTFEPRSTPEPTTTQTQLPSVDAVVDGRFVKPVQLDDGQLRVDPAPAGTEPPMPRSDVEEELWASPTFQGKSGEVLGWGLVTLTVKQHGIDTVTSVPAWIAFGWGGWGYHCPMMTAAPSPVDLPSDGYVAVVMNPAAQVQPFSYTARSSICGNPPVGPTVEPATHVESVSWDQIGPVSNGSVEIMYTPTPCGSDATFTIAGAPTGSTLEVDVTVPDTVAHPCPSPEVVRETVNLPDGATQLQHAPTGYVRQL